MQWLSLSCTESPHPILASASEDGSAKTWDARTGSQINSFVPSKRRDLVRPDLGPWLSCVCLDSSAQWLVCGGGPSLSVWHLQSGEMAQAMEIQGATQHHVSCDPTSGEILVGSSDNNVYTYSINGALVRKVPTNVPVVYHALKSDRVTQLTTVAGQCCKVDVFTNPGYVAFSLNIRG